MHTSCPLFKPRLPVGTWKEGLEVVLDLFVPLSSVPALNKAPFSAALSDRLFLSRCNTQPLLIPYQEPTTDQSMDNIRVQLGEPMNFIGLKF